MNRRDFVRNSLFTATALGISPALFSACSSVDPLHEYIKKYPGRYEILHVKDAFDVTDRESFACVGSGVIDFEPILQLRDIGGFKHLIVERDRGEMPEQECARSSIDYLKTLKF